MATYSSLLISALVFRRSDGSIKIKAGQSRFVTVVRQPDKRSQLRMPHRGMILAVIGPFHVGKNNHRKFQPFRLMDCHQPHHVGAFGMRGRERFARLNSPQIQTTER